MAAKKKARKAKASRKKGFGIEWEGGKARFGAGFGFVVEGVVPAGFKRGVDADVVLRGAQGYPRLEVSSGGVFTLHTAAGRRSLEGPLRLSRPFSDFRVAVGARPNGLLFSVNGIAKVCRGVFLEAPDGGAVVVGEEGSAVASASLYDGGSCVCETAIDASGSVAKTSGQPWFSVFTPGAPVDEAVATPEDEAPKEEVAEAPAAEEEDSK